VDFLFNSAAHMYCSGVLAVVMTGMGSDGLAGSRCVHESGGAVLTQDQATSAVWGMPGRVFGAGLSREPLPVGELAAEITRRVWAGRRGRAPAPARPRPQPQPLAIREVTHGLL
jgi:two-component system chemotaxis response regulator CheB